MKGGFFQSVLNCGSDCIMSQCLCRVFVMFSRSLWNGMTKGRLFCVLVLFVCLYRASVCEREFIFWNCVSMSLSLYPLVRSMMRSVCRRCLSSSSFVMSFLYRSA